MIKWMIKQFRYIPARGGSGAPASRTLAGKETPPAAPDKRARLAIALLGSPGGVWARDIPP